MGDTVAVIGLEDIAFGKGTRQVPTYGGETRTITEVNLANIPFDETKTVGQAMEELVNQLKQAKYNTVAENIDKIQAIVSNLDKLNTIVLQMDTIVNVNNNLVEFRQVYLQLSTLLGLVDKIDTIETLRNEATHNRDLTKQYYDSVVTTTNNINKLVNDYINPLSVKLDATMNKLNHQVETAVATINEGHEMCIKLATYSLKIKPMSNCYNPRVVIDDANKAIIWEVPRMKGECVVKYQDIPDTIISDKITEYLKGLGNAGTLPMTNLGTIIGEVDTYDNLASLLTDQLGNLVSVNDVAIVKTATDTHPQGLYRATTNATNSEPATWELIKLTADAVNEDGEEVTVDDLPADN